MAKRQKKKFYAVAKGRKVGIYKNWPDCEAQVKHFPGAKYKSFDTQEEADEYIKQINWDYRVQHKQCTPLRQRQPSDDSIWNADYIGFDDDCAHPSSTPFTIGKRSYLRGAESVKVISTSSGKQQNELEQRAKLAKRVASSHIDPEETDKRHSKHYAAVKASADRSTKRAKLAVERPESISKLNIDTAVQVDDQVRIIQVYTDGACSDNGKLTARAGWGVYWPESEDKRSDLYGLNESGRVPGDRTLQTNNRAELLGLIRAIQICPDDSAQLEIKTDSQYCINVVDVWQRIWRRNNWMTADDLPVSNKDLIRRLEREMRSRSHRPKLTWVKGHSKDRGNRKADRLAVKGKNLPMVPPHLVPNFEPSDSEEEGDGQNYENAVKMWIKFGLSREQAEQRVGPVPQ